MMMARRLIITLSSVITLHVLNSLAVASELKYETCLQRYKYLYSDKGAKLPPDDDEPLLDDVVSLRNPKMHSTVKSKVRLWDKGIVPYLVAQRLTQDQQRRLDCALSYFHERTCLVFRPKRSSDYNYVDLRMSASGGCYSINLGKNGGRHEVNLAYPPCWRINTIIHELMHAIGFFHEQSRNDRDQYITVHWANIPPQWRSQFNTGKQMGVEQYLVGNYDYYSVMHYRRYIWGSRPNMSAKQQPVDKNNAAMGIQDGPSPMDTQKINSLYQCSTRKKEVKPTTSKPIVISSDLIYQGCFNSPKLRCEVLDNNSPNQCYERCRNTYPVMTISKIINGFALRENYCCCYPSEYLLKGVKNNEKSCNINCTGSNVFRCGGRTRSTNYWTWTISVYTFEDQGFCPKDKSVYITNEGKIMRSKDCSGIRCKDDWSCYQNGLVAACCPGKYSKPKYE